MRIRIAAGLLATVTSVLGAQSGGPYAPVVLLEPAGARTLAMGNVGVAGRDDDVLFYNPAQLAVARGMSVSAERYSANAGGGTLSAVTRFGNGGIAVGAQTVDYDSPGFFPDRGTMLGVSNAPGTSTEAAVALAQTIKGVRLGVAGKYAEDEGDGLRVGRAAVDVGAAKDLTRQFTIAAAVQNIGGDMRVPCASRAVLPQCPTLPTPSSGVDPRIATIDLPLRTTVGASFARELGPFDLFSTASASMYRTNWISPAAGAELGYSWLDGYDVDLRAGLRRPLAGEDAFTAGAGFTRDRLSIDYALETFTGGRVGHRIGVRVR